MKYQITQLSCYTEQILRNLISGTVHSVYRRTINLTDGKQILSLQADHSPLSPISLILTLTAEEMGELGIAPGDAVLFKEGSLELRGEASYHFTYTDARRYDLKLQTPLDSRSRALLVSGIRNALALTGTNGFALLFGRADASENGLSLMLLAAKKHIHLTDELCRLGDYPEAAVRLSRLLGLGIGLTPSGDDFLCGVLAGLHMAGNDSHPFTQRLRSELANRLSDTIDISAAFLSCALDQQFSLAVNHLCRLPTAEEILASFEEIGHSSGTDTLCGILWSLTHFPK